MDPFALVVGAGELLGLDPVAGPLAVFDLTLPNDISLCGRRLYTQAMHLGGLAPFALSNAQDLLIGYKEGPRS